MRILIDESLPRTIKGELPGHSAATVTEQGWSGLDNGDPLRAASPSFDVSWPSLSWSLATTHSRRCSHSWAESWSS